MNTPPFAVRPLIDAHDLISKNPPIEGWQGWLLGDGAAGATIWNPANRIALQFGHTDLLDDGPGSAAMEEAAPCLRHAAQAFVEIVDTPLFDPAYLKSYQARLSLAEGILTATGGSEFGKFSFKAWFAEKPGIFVLEYTDDCVESVRRRFRLQRYGSRTLHPWSAGKIGSTRTGLDGTRISQPQAGVFLAEHHYAGFHCATAARLEAGGLPYHVHVDAHGLTAEFDASPKAQIRVLFAVGLPDQKREAATIAVESLTKAAAIPAKTQRAEHVLQKTTQWDDSFVHLPQDPYFAALWYLARYHIKASWRGKYPPFFINGPWGWMRDVRTWPSCWYHWNFHGASLSMAHLGEQDAMLATYAPWRHRQIPTAQKNARRFFKCNGAVFQDLQQPDGKTDCWEGDYHTQFIVTGLQTCVHLYDLWRVTGDRRFLIDILHPYLQETILFLRDYLQTDDQGILHVPRSLPYEFHGGHAFRDCLTDLAHIRVLLPAFARVAREAGQDDELANWCRDAMNRLAGFKPIGFPIGFVTELTADGRRVYNNPFFHGDPARDTDQVLAIGISEREKDWVSHVHTHASVITTGGYGVLCSAQTAHIYPNGLVTSDFSPQWADVMEASSEQRQLWEMSVNALRTIRRYPVEVNASDMSEVAEPTIAWTGHSLELPAFARMGLTGPLRKAMDFYIDRYQLFPQGMWNYHPRKRWWLGSARFPFRDGEQGRCEYNPWHLHFAFEPQGIFSETVCLMLMDSAGDVIRLFPAYDRDATFRLPARGGFSVTAQQIEGRLTAVEIQSRLGEACVIRLPWPAVGIRDDHGNEQTLAVVKGVAAFPTQAGRRYHLHEAGGAGEFMPITPCAAAPREHGPSTLGVLRRM